LDDGVASAALLALADDELDAVLQIVVRDSGRAELSSCTGTLVAPGWIPSAAHFPADCDCHQSGQAVRPRTDTFV
jgi:hypothetical protein